MRRLLVAWLIVVGLGGIAEARRGGGAFVIINTGDTIIHIRDLKVEATRSSDPESPAHTFNKLGYRHDRFGVFWFDLWRWDGEFVIYDGDAYISISDEAAAQLGASVPWRYHLPDGLLILIAVAYFALIGRRRRRVKTGFVIAGFMFVVAIAFFFMGLTWEFAIPLAIAVHHGFSARAAMRAVDDEDPDSTEDVPRVAQPSAPRAAQPSAPRAAVGTPPPDARPSQPIVVERPPVVAAPIVVPMRPDDSADGPKLLR